MTYDRGAIDICGYTHKEVQDNFKGYIEELSKKKGLSFSEAWEKLKLWYNGYRFCEDEEQVFNPLFIDVIASRKRISKTIGLRQGIQVF